MFYYSYFDCSLYIIKWIKHRMSHCIIILINEMQYICVLLLIYSFVVCVSVLNCLCRLSVVCWRALSLVGADARARLRWLACPGERVITSKGQRVVRVRQQSVELGLTPHWEHLALPHIHAHIAHFLAPKMTTRLRLLYLSPSTSLNSLAQPFSLMRVLICIRLLQLQKTVLCLTKWRPSSFVVGGLIPLR